MNVALLQDMSSYVSPVFVHLSPDSKPTPTQSISPGEQGLWLSSLCPQSSEYTVSGRPRALSRCSETWMNTRQHEKCDQRRGLYRYDQEHGASPATELPQGAWPRPPAETSPDCAVCVMSLRPTFWVLESCPQAYASVGRMPGPPSGKLEGPGTKFPHKELTLAVGDSFKGQVCFKGTLQCPPE